MTVRFPSDFPEDGFARGLTKLAAASFLAQAVLGNMRGFVFACNALRDATEQDAKVGLTDPGSSLVRLASNYYWPLLDEIQPKLGKYEPLVLPARQVAEIAFGECAQKPRSPRDIIIYREIDEKLSKPLQILEYAGFVSKREASKAMKSGGRGARYALNLSNLLEQIPSARLTKDLFDQWLASSREEAVQYHRASKLASLPLPVLPEAAELAIFREPIEKLQQSNAYPYGLTPAKISVLKNAGINTVGDLAEADNDQLDDIATIGPAMVRRIRNVLGQAIWM